MINRSFHFWNVNCSKAQKHYTVSSDKSEGTTKLKFMLNDYFQGPLLNLKEQYGRLLVFQTVFKVSTFAKMSTMCNLTPVMYGQSSPAK